MGVTFEDHSLTNEAEPGKYRVSTPTRFCNRGSFTNISSPTLTFPILDFDGTTPDVIETHPPPGEVTPPAALSTLGIKMAEAERKKKESSSELEDGQYDMMDDASEFSLDGQETASIASDGSSLDGDGQLTPDDTGSVVDLSEASADQEYKKNIMLLEEQNNKKRSKEEQKAATAGKKTEAEKTEEALHSFLTEDLETLRQSTIYEGCTPKSDMINDAESGAAAGCEKRTILKTSHSSTHKLKKCFTNPANVYGIIFILVSLALTSISPYFSVDLATSQALRKGALDTSLEKAMGISEVSKTINTTHLLPMPTHVSTNFFGQQVFGVSDVHFQGMSPNTMIISLPIADSRIPLAKSSQVLKGAKPVAFNQTLLIPGVYKLDFDPKEAYGTISVNMQTSKPSLNISVSHNYGHRMFQKQTYEKARTDLTKAVNKDVGIARKSAKSLTELIQLELGASVAATKNVTTQLAVHLNRDLQLWASNTASMFTKAAVAGNSTYFSMRKDLMRVEKRLDDAGSDAYKRLSKAGAQVAKSVTEPLVLSRERAVALKDKLFGCKQGKKSSKEVAKREDRILRTAARKLKAGKVMPSMEEKRRVKPQGKKCGSKKGHMK